MNQHMDPRLTFPVGGEGALWEAKLPDGSYAAGLVPTKEDADRIIDEAKANKAGELDSRPMIARPFIGWWEWHVKIPAMVAGGLILGLLIGDLDRR